MSRIRRVLFAEDDTLVSAVLCPLLETMADEVVAVATGSEALEQLAEASFDLLVTDYQMPGATGLEVLQAAHRLFPAMRLVMISGYADESVEAEVKSQGGVLLHKPFGAADLRAAVSAAVAASAARSD